ncbi:Protein CBR-CYK-7 [Caenorhabditis briggsae]|uniref:Protein CBR-CYK-7 n=1 Tax=Caenorhabditis briggsae TaxID=6238 RepID=A8WM59_CAEBR|nr:Protein CBR-CYK-7 [Caenorhabditis briggsae]CAP21563.2 Protein CBR-CYK-7 [Caenorhabditis briggsae]
MSDNLSARWHRLLDMTNRDASEDVVIARSSYDDFSQPTPWRTFEISAGNRSFDFKKFVFEFFPNFSNFFSFVNAGWLAELSPYFAEELFVRKPNSKRYVIEQATPEEVLELLRCITFCPMRKPLTVKNVSLVLTFANRFEMRPVQARCENFIALNATTLSRDKTKLFQVTCAMSQCDPNSSTMSVLVDKLAGIKEDELSRLHFAEMPGDVVAEVYAQKLQRTKDKKSARYMAAGDGEDSPPVGCCFTNRRLSERFLKFLFFFQFFIKIYFSSQWATSMLRRRHRRTHPDDQSILPPANIQD